MSRPRYNWPCPTCGAPPNEPCRTTFLAKHPGRVTDTHEARFRVRFESVPVSETP